MYVVCMEHVELALERFIDDFEEAPDVVDLQKVQFSDWVPPETCRECSQAARFLIV